MIRLRGLLGVGAFYLVAVLVATYPRVWGLASELPTLADPLTHLWTLRWYRACLLQGLSPFFNPGLQAPVGFPMGLVPPLPLHLAGFVVLRGIIPNDVLCYNLLWLAGFVFTGLGTFVLAWRLTGDRAAALVAGLAAMLSGPMMLHGFEHLELITLGAFPLFLWAWVEFVDAPTRRRLGFAVLFYLLLTASAPYFGVLAVFPAGLYVVWRSLADGLRGTATRRRIVWLGAFAFCVIPALPLFFAPQIWAAWHGYGVTRSKAEFLTYGTTLWSYATPTAQHALGGWMPFDLQAAAGFEWRVREKGSYLGLVVLGLVQVAAWRRVKMERQGFWWACLGLLVLLSLGGEFAVGDRRIGLPGGWLFDHVKPFRLLRVPARFNLFAAVLAACLAGAGLAALRGGLRGRWTRRGLTAACALAVVLDLAIVPYGAVALPSMPRSYAWIKGHGGDGPLLEIPQSFSAHNLDVSTAAAYWQSIHGMPTSAGYGAHGHAAYDALINYGSPFNVFAMRKPEYLADGDRLTLGPFVDLRVRDYAWLYAKVHGFKWIVLHRWARVPGIDGGMKRLEEILAGAFVHGDADSALYDPALLGPPTNATILGVEGWGQTSTWEGRPTRTLDPISRLAIYQPEGGGPLRLEMEGIATAGNQVALVKCDGVQVARWKFGAEEFGQLITPRLDLTPGLHWVEITWDAGVDERERDPARSSARVARIQLIELD